MSHPRSEQFSRLESVVKSSLYKRSHSVHGPAKTEFLNATFHSGSLRSGTGSLRSGSTGIGSVRSGSSVCGSSVYGSRQADAGRSLSKSLIRPLAHGTSDHSHASVNDFNSVDNESSCDGSIFSAVTSRSFSRIDNNRNTPQRNVIHHPQESNSFADFRSSDVANYSSDNLMEHDGLDDSSFYDQRSLMKSGDEMEHDGISDMVSKGLNLFTVRDRLERADRSAPSESGVPKEEQVCIIPDEFNMISVNPAKFNAKQNRSLSPVENVSKGVVQISRPVTTKKQSTGCCYYVIMLIMAVLLAIIVMTLFGMKFDGLKKCAEINEDGFRQFAEKLHENLYGQHIAKQLLLSNLAKFYGFGSDFCAADGGCKNQKQLSDSENVLVFSFHGWAGIGKTFTSYILSGLFHDVAHHIVIPIHYNNEHDQNWREWIVKNATKCNDSLIIIDELDKASDEFVKSLKSSLLDLRSDTTNKHRKIAVVLISNDLGNMINLITFKHIQSDKDISGLQPNDFEHLVEDNSQTRLLSDMYSSGMIDVFVPFLPLSKSNVELCIRRDLKLKKVMPNSALIANIESDLFYVNVGDRAFSKSGCKRVADKVDLHITKLGA